MDYQITAARRRPRRFEELIGQDFVASTLQKSIETKKIAPAYLLSGPRGCGKTSTARILATALNCTSGPTPTPCGTCPSCLEITAGNHLDVIEIDGASNTGVNDVRQIKDEILFPPNSARYKIYIIDEVHMLSTSAFNALLKTIEEPPPYVIFIFATTELHKVPATIKSRCQQFSFKLVSVENLYEAISQAAAELQIVAEDEALYWIARQARGSVRDAYTLFDQIAAFSDGSIQLKRIQEKLGLPGLEPLSALIDACAENNTQKALSLFDSMLMSGVSIEQCAIDCADYMRNLLLITHHITKQTLLGGNAEQFSRKALATWNSSQIEKGLSLFLNVYKDLRFSLNPRYEMELTLARLAHLHEFVSPAEMRKAFDAARALLHSSKNNTTEKKNTKKDHINISAQQTKQNLQPIPNSTQAKTENIQKSTVVIETKKTKIIPTEAISISELKNHIINELKEEQYMLTLSLQKTSPWILDDTIIHIFTETVFDADTILEKKTLLQEISSQALKKDVQIEVDIKNTKKIINKYSVPKKIHMLKNELKGTIINNSDKNAIQNIRSQNEPQSL